MTCPICGKPQRRPHRHGDTELALRIRYGRFTAEEQRTWIRGLLRQAQKRP